MQRLADAANNGFFDGPVDAKIQGPYDGHNMAGYEVDTFTRKLFISGGVGIAAVLPMLKRMAVHMENTASEAGTHFLQFLYVETVFAIGFVVFICMLAPFVLIHVTGYEKGTQNFDKMVQCTRHATQSSSCFIPRKQRQLSEAS